MHGLDDVARTLRREDEIAAFEAGYVPRFDVSLVALAGAADASIRARRISAFVTALRWE